MNQTPAPNPVPSAQKQVLIGLRDINMVRENRTILRDICLDIHRNDFIAITGPNGGGKTTLLRIILRLLTPTTGTVTYFDPEGMAADRLPIGYLPQKNMIDSRFPITVMEVVASGLIGAKGLPREEKDEKIREIIELMELSSHARQSIGELSGGQLQRALLGRAFHTSPEFLVLDEPLSYLDKRFEERLYDIVRQLAAEKTIILVSHEMSVIGGMAGRHLIVDHTVHECSGHHHFIPSDCR